MFSFHSVGILQSEVSCSLPAELWSQACLLVCLEAILLYVTPVLRAPEWLLGLHAYATMPGWSAFLGAKHIWSAYVFAKILNFMKLSLYFQMDKHFFLIISFRGENQRNHVGIIWQLQGKCFHCRSHDTMSYDYICTIIYRSENHLSVLKYYEKSISQGTHMCSCVHACCCVCWRKGFRTWIY